MGLGEKMKNKSKKILPEVSNTAGRIFDQRCLKKEFTNKHLYKRIETAPLCENCPKGHYYMYSGNYLSWLIRFFALVDEELQKIKEIGEDGIYHLDWNEDKIKKLEKICYSIPTDVINNSTKPLRFPINWDED